MRRASMSSGPSPVAILALAAALAAGCAVPTLPSSRPALMDLGDAWAANSVNAAVFRNDPVTTAGDRQFAAYYDAAGRVVVAARTIGQAAWTPTVTPFTGDVRDAHNVISLIADGAGHLHLSWDHHGHPLRYARSATPATPDFDEERPMTGTREANVTYPQFFRLADGDLLFFYRDGGSGDGNLVLNRYDVRAGTWTRLHDELISGEGLRNAYWQAAVGADGSVHLSWVWRESPDVATNHDLCYARSVDGGATWTRSDATPYALPITAATAEVARAIPQRSELINQTSMCVDGRGRPIITTYFRDAGERVVQYHVVRHDGAAWRTARVTNRETPFSLSGGGSKRIPIARPQVLARTNPADGTTAVHLIYRDVTANGGRAVVTSCASIDAPRWTTRELTDFDVRYWEPSLDRVRWARDGVLNLYVQRVGQGDGETLDAVGPQPAYVLEWTP